MSEKKAVTPDHRGYESSYQSFSLLKKFRTDLNHDGHGPKPETFGISEDEAKWIRARIDRDLDRS